MVARTPGHGMGGHGPMGRPLTRGRFGSRAARASAAVLAIAAGLALSAPAQAQTATTLVSNASETRTATSSTARATNFTAGSNSGGYTITEIQLWLNDSDLASELPVLKDRRSLAPLGPAPHGWRHSGSSRVPLARNWSSLTMAT